jgi:FixJ family two-component response regulator
VPETLTAPADDDIPSAIYILSADDARRDSFREALAELGAPVHAIASVRDLLGGAATAGCALLDLPPSDLFDGDLIGAIAEAAPAVALVVVTDAPTTEAVVRAMRSGAVNVLDQPVPPDRLREAVREALRLSDERADGLKERRGAAVRVGRLSAEQSDVLRRAMDGLPNKAIAAELDMSLRKVERLRAGAFDALGVTTLAEAAKIIHLADMPRGGT